MRPPELELVQRLRARNPEELSTLEHAFITASVDGWEAHNRWRRRARTLGVDASIVFVVVVSILGLVAWRQSAGARREQAETELQKAESERQKAEAERQKAEAERSAKIAEERLAASDLEQGRALLLDGHPMRALPYLLAARAEGVEHSPVLQMLYARTAAALPRMADRQVPLRSEATSRTGLLPYVQRQRQNSRCGIGRVLPFACDDPLPDAGRPVAPPPHG